MPFAEWVSDEETFAPIIMEEIREAFPYFPAYEKPGSDDPDGPEIPF